MGLESNPPINVNRENTRLFSSIGVETSSLCNRTCVFCPNHENKRPDELMPWWMIEKIADELGSMNYKGRIEPYIYNEPMRDPRLLDVIRLFRERVPRSCIMINTNGDFARDGNDLVALYEAGLNQLQVNIYSAADGCGDPEKEARGVENAKRRAATVQRWLDEMGVDQKGSLYHYASPSVNRGQVSHRYGVSTESATIDGKFQLANRSGNIAWIPGVDEPLEKGCARPFRFFNIDWRGDAILCCNDYYSKTSFGSVADSTLVELWNHPRLHEYRVKMQAKDRNCFLCDKCDFYGGPYQHNVQRVTFGPEQDKAILSSYIGPATQLTVEGKNV